MHKVDAYRMQMREEFELGWRPAGAIARENEGPDWMRRLIISFRCSRIGDRGDTAEWHETRPSHQMM